MRHLIFSFCLILSTCLIGQNQSGYFDFNWDDDSGKITLEIPADRIGEEFLYVSSLSAGVGSNDIGLDRGQLGQERVVRFEKIGPKILLVQPNLDYRAVSDNELERRSVEEAFAKSVIWGFEIIKSDDKKVHKVDLTPFLMNDMHGVSRRLKSSNQGSYKLDKSRSAVWMPRTKSFPDNTEFDAMLTFVGEAKGRYIRSVTPNADAVSVRQHHSFIKLPDSNYKPRVFHPFSGLNSISYADYATPIESSLVKRYIVRHRLEKKNPNAAVSEAVEPIIYYMDPGCPDPVKSALMEGARWWDQAYQAAGFAPGTFQVKELPAGADMMDVRYNVIQWVHRSTRGWSYGASVIDPRTGEIMKGHVSLGSLRVRQDYLIAQGILSPFGDSDNNTQVMKELALARLRQLAAHEVGHTIGLAHNFASSVKNRASVMDYPHPYIELTSSGDLDFSNAYDTKIGDWDKVTITYGYAQFPPGTDEQASLTKIINDAQKAGFQFISDSDSRPLGGAHPDAHLWDNGTDVTAELNRMMTLRGNALKRFGESSIPSGMPLSQLENVLVPLYLMHRYQMEGVAKMIGGLTYQYNVKGDAHDHKVKPVSLDKQGQATRSILNTVLASELALPDHIVELIPPPAFGYSRNRETFKGRTHLAFDVLAPAESYSHMVFSMLLQKDRLARIQRHNVAHGHPMKLSEYLEQVSSVIFLQESVDPYHSSLEDIVKNGLVHHLLMASHGQSVDPLVAAEARACLGMIKKKYLSKDSSFSNYLNFVIDKGLENPSDIEMPKLLDLPPGSPIGCDAGL